MVAIRQFPRRWLLVGLIFLALGAAACPAALRAATPDSPEVKQMIDRALKWLEKQSDERLGGRCLIGLSFFKAKRSLSDPHIRGALLACQEAIRTDMSAIDNYSLGLALVFLLETDPAKNRNLATHFVNELLRKQQRGGAWGYPGSELGDTSQTQYPTLGLWLAMNNEINVPITALERDCGWLLRTQDPSGAWGYQGNDPNRFERVNQSEIRPALVAAGLGSLYICADLLGINERKASAEQDPNKPTALRPIGDPLGLNRTVSATIDPKLVRRATTDGNYWFTKHYTLESEGFTHYYLYAFERYQSFRELAEGRSDPNPKWYNDVVAMLKKTQQPDGEWSGNDTPVVATCFAVLTLLRSAKATIAKVSVAVGEGVLLGGMGLPKTTADLQEKEGKLVETPLAGTIDELVATIEKGNPTEIEKLAESSARWKLDSDVTKRSGELARLRAIVASGSIESRYLTVRALARVRELDNVPLLIYAMSDPDLRVVREADKGLRFISRKFDGVGLPEEPTPIAVKNAITAWKAWYKSIRPSAEFLDAN